MTTQALLCGSLPSSRNKADRGEQKDETSCRVFGKTSEQVLMVVFVRVISVMQVRVEGLSPSARGWKEFGVQRD